MNPANWSRERQLALFLASVIGAALGIIMGYFVDASAGGAMSFHVWITYPLRNAILWWGLFGALVGAGVVYIRNLISS